MRRERIGLAFAVVLACAGLTASASAHVGHVVQRAERYLKLDVAGHDARVVVSLSLGPEEGRRVLESVDANGDGEVDERESEAHLGQWAEGLRVEVPVRVDGEPVEISWRDGYLAPIGRVRPVPLSVEMVGHFELEGGRQTVRIEDGMVRREVYDRTDVAFRVRDGAELVASGLESEADGLTPALMYPGDYGGAEPVPLVAVVQTPARERAAPRSMIVAAAGGLVLLAAFLFSRRKR